MRDLCVLVVQQDPRVSGAVEAELAAGGIRVAGPVGDLDRAVGRAQGQHIDAVLLDLGLGATSGAATFAAFRVRCPGLPAIVMAPRASEPAAREAVAAGAALYLLREEAGRGLLVPVVRHVAAARAAGEPTDGAAASRLLHDLGNALAVASGESEMLEGRAADGDAIVEDLRELRAVVEECVRLFRKYAATRRSEAAAAPER
jgi:DNA-binding NarL/FixJ family response regulator